MATTIIGSIAANDLVAIASHGAGSLPFGPFAVPAGYTQLMVVFDLRQVDTLTATLTAAVEVSFDSGGNWTSVGSGTLSLPSSGYVLNGSVLTRSAGDPLGPGPVRMFGKSFMLKQTDLSTRQVRGTLSIDEALISGVTLVGF